MIGSDIYHTDTMMAPINVTASPPRAIFLPFALHTIFIFSLGCSSLVGVASRSSFKQPSYRYRKINDDKLNPIELFIFKCVMLSFLQDDRPLKVGTLQCTDA